MRRKRGQGIPASVRFERFDSPGYPDGSGAPAIVSVRGFRFACDYLGKPTLNLIGPLSGSRVESEVAARIARNDYLLAVHATTTAGWREMSRSLYAQ